jgi:hypothetical protein
MRANFDADHLGKFVTGKAIKPFVTKKLRDMSNDQVDDEAGELLVIPPKLLKQVAKQLIAKTLVQSGTIMHWQREKHDREFFFAQQGIIRFVLRFYSARLEADVIEFGVQANNMEEIGTLKAQEGDDAYDCLAELLFAVQRTEGRGQIKAVADEIIKLLPTDERGQWTK